MASTGMIIDGLAASEAIDSSGEILDVDGCDITDFEEGKGLFNWEHRGDDAQGASGLDIVGKIVYAKKIKKEADCENDRQRKYWDKVHLPFIYIIGRLYDGAGHAGAAALAAQIRDHLANNELILVRFSIEGSTLDRDGNRLTRSVARRVALTVKPCNRTCDSGVLEDPHAPPGFEKKPEPEAVRDMLEDIATKKFEHPSFMKLGGSTEIECDPRLDGTRDLIKSLAKLKMLTKLRKSHSQKQCMDCASPPTHEVKWAEGMAHAWFCDKHWREWFKKNPQELELVRKLTEGRVEDKYGEAPGHALAKATEAGSTAGAPSTLTGGAALQREDMGLGKRPGRGELVRQAMAMFREYERKATAFDKSEFQTFLKHKLPDCDSDFIDHFADMIEDYKVKLSKREKAEPGLKLGKKPAPKAPAKAKAKAVSKIKDEPKLKVKAKAKAQPTLFELGEPPLTVRGKPVASVPNQKGAHFDETTGTLHTSRGSFPMYIPGRDPVKGAKESFHNIMEDPKINEFHGYVMDNWSRLNKLLKEGRLPPEVVMHATLFSQLSPNTPVPIQELMYSHLVDTMREHGVDALHPEFASLKQPWLNSSSPTQLPHHSRQHFQDMGNQIRLGTDSLDTNRKKGDIWSFQLANDKFKNMTQYRELHDPLVKLINTHRDDARAGTQELMYHKNKAELWAAARRRHLEAGKPDPGAYRGGPAVPGLAPKTARYTYGMMGGGNVTVPDTHFIRYLFGMDKHKDAGSLKFLKNLLWQERNSHVLEGIDRYYAKHHDAVRHMREHPKFKHLFQNDEAAIFPAFWKNWVGITPHEQARGISTSGYTENTNHRPFWEAIDPFVLGKSEASDPEPGLAYRTAMTHARWAHEHGEIPALMLYYKHLVPQLLDEAEHRQHDPVLKTMTMLMDLKKAASESHSVAVDDHRHFQGRKVHPGSATGGGQKFEVLGETPEAFLARGREGLVRLPKTRAGTHFEIQNKPESVFGPAVVDGKSHGISGLSDGPEQQQLIHGVDLKNHNPNIPSWRPMANGTMAYVRGDPSDMGWTRAKSEAAYYNAARDVFGLHGYVPVAAAFKHPDAEKDMDMAAVAAVPGAEHLDVDGSGRAQGSHAEILRQLGDSGELDKLMLMDMVMGNRSRTDHNSMFTFQSEPHLRLVDHGLLDGLSLGTPPRQGQPSYMQHFHPQWQGLPLHDQARAWLDGLDLKKLEASLSRSGMPYHMADEASRRLLEAKAHVQKMKSTATKGSTYMAPWSQMGQG